jgi:hypothetical protein
MRREIRWFTIVLLASCVAADDDGGDSPPVPKEVTYVPASAAINAKAVDIIKKTLAPSATDDQVAALFTDKGMVCAPGLWQDLKADKSLAKLTLGDAELMVPYKDKDGKTRSDKMIGKVFASKDDQLVLWKAFSGKNDLKHVKVRKLTTKELSLTVLVYYFLRRYRTSIYRGMRRSASAASVHIAR